MKNKLQTIKEYFLIFVGAVIAAFAVEEFLNPCTILDGGIIGISIMGSRLTGVSLGLLTVLLNIPFLVIGARRMGTKFILRSSFAMLTFSLAVTVFEPWVNATYEHLLAVCFGGVILGIGVGLVIRYDGCLDGTETVAMLLNRRYGFPVGQMVLGMNVVIYSVAGILFGLDRAMYSLLTYFVTSKVIDMVENGFDQVKATMIITDEAEEIADAIYNTLGRTCTILEGRGLISGEKVILYCVVNRFEVHTLKKLIHSVDASSFVTVSEVSEIIGEHIKKTEERSEVNMKEEAL